MPTPLTPEAQAAAEKWLVDRMRRAPFTFQQLWTGAEAATGADCYRLADRLIQRERKAGRIKMLPGRKGWEPA